MILFITVSYLQPQQIFPISLLFLTPDPPPPRILLRQRSLRDTEELKLRALCAVNMDGRERREQSAARTDAWSDMSEEKTTERKTKRDI
jgi:hypothetical protein